jgi:hypothetical protein
MIIFLKNIPINSKKYEIAAFIEPRVNHCCFGKSLTKVRIQDIEILSIQDMDNDSIEKHALVKVFPQEVGKCIMKRIDGVLFKNTTIAAREYVNRSSANDHRNLSQSDYPRFQDRRIFDRRRKPLMNSWQRDPILVQAVR